MWPLAYTDVLPCDPNCPPLPGEEALGDLILLIVIIVVVAAILEELGRRRRP